MKHRYATAALAKVAHSQARRRTKRQPGQVATTERARLRAGLASTCTRHRPRRRTGTRRCRARTRSAPPAPPGCRPAPGPPCGTRAGAPAGPARSPARGARTGRSSGTTASNAGAKNAAPVPYMAARIATCQTSRALPAPARRAPCRRRPGQVRADHDPPPLEAVARHPSEQEEDRRHGHRDADDGHRRGRVGELVDLPRHGDEERAVAEQRDAHRHPEPAEPRSRRAAAPTRAMPPGLSSAS